MKHPDFPLVSRYKGKWQNTHSAVPKRHRRNTQMRAKERKCKSAKERKRVLKKREGVPEMGTKPLKALRGYRASNRGSNRGSRGSNRGSKGSKKKTEALCG